MKPLILRATIALGALTVAGLLTYAQIRPHPQDEPTPKLKQSQVDAILKEDHKKSLEDAAALMKLSEELRMELEKNDKNILSLAAIKKTEEIEKLAKRIRGRMKRF